AACRSCGWAPAPSARTDSARTRGLFARRCRGSANDLELAHEPVVLVVEHVAVDHVLARGEGVAEVAGDIDRLVRLDEERLLEAVLPGWRRLAVAGDQVPVGGVDVEDVGHAGLVVDLPNLGGVERRLMLDVGGVERPAVDQPRGTQAAAADR